MRRIVAIGYDRMKVQEGLHHVLGLLLVYARLYLHTTLRRMLGNPNRVNKNAYTHYRNEIENIFLRHAHDAVLPSNVPPVIVTSTGSPQIMIAPPASNAVLPLNVPPSIEMSNTPFPSQYSFCRKTKGQPSTTIDLQTLNIIEHLRDGFE